MKLDQCISCYTLVVLGHILDDEDLISTLQKSKTMSVEIGGRMSLSEQTEKDMNYMRKKYLPVSNSITSNLFLHLCNTAIKK